MAETSCLRRSFSNPSEMTLDFSEGDPARALGESISFGRYMSESLAWEKWSAFTSNRYLEEAEKYSKPGSVAKMKAYFEAHYGRFGAKKRAAQEQAINKGCRLDAQDFPDTDSILSSLALNPVNSRESHAVDNPDVDVLSSGTVDTCSSPTQPINVKNETGNSVESVAVADVVSCLPEVEVHQCQDTEVDASVIERSVQTDNVKDVEKIDVIIPPECEVTVKIDVGQEKVEKEKLESMCERKPDDYCVISLKKTNLSRLSSSISRLATPVRCKKDGNGTPNSKVTKLSSSFIRLTTPVHAKKEGHVTPNSKTTTKLSSSFARLATPTHPSKEGRVTPNNKVAKLSSSFARLATPTRPRKEDHNTPSRRMLAKVSVDERKLASNTSINISSDTNVAKNPSSATRKVGFGKVFTPLGKIIRDGFSSSSTPSRASVNSVSRYPSTTPQSEIKRSRVALEKSFDRSKMLDQKLKSPCVANVKSAPSPATFASFNFRTEERAAKRKELMQKRLEKEAEYFQQIESAKVKPTPDYKKSSQSRNLKANAAEYIRTEVLTDNTKKIPPSRLRLPKSEPKPTPESKQDKTFRPPQMTTGSKNFLVKTKGHENASPNIL